MFCQSSGWQVMRTQEQKEENTGKRQMQIGKKQVRDRLIHAAEIAAIDFHGFTNLCHKEFHS
ncbi:hypothetical protein DMI62_04645 [Escherichia coli]|nr:hypothetical protein [Escherichia coli]